MTGAAAPGPALCDRLLATAVLALAVGSGLLSFMLGNAPASYAMVNAGALVLASLALLIPGTKDAAWPAILVLIVAPLLLAATLLVEPGTLGVHRWIAFGPLRFHAAMLIVPALVTVAAARRDSASLAAMALCSALVWLQPDFAAALSLTCGMLFATAGRKLQPIEHGMGLFAMAAMVMTSFKPDPLGPVPFVETALADGFALHPVLGTVMAWSLALALFLPSWLMTRSSPDRQWSARGLTGAMIGFTLPALLAPYPQPLVGYGASAILGYGLALAVLRFSR